MTGLIPFVYLAGVVQLAVASANVVAFAKFRYLEHLAAVPRIVRQVFIVQNGYLMAVQVGLALQAFGFADELVSGRPLVRAMAAFLALFWGVRVGLQLGYYDAALRRANRAFDVLFLLADSYLAVLYAALALGPA